MGEVDVLKEINDAAGSRNIPVLVLSAQGRQNAAVTKLDHQLIRPFAVSPFDLRHMWIDLRKKL